MKIVKYKNAFFYLPDGTVKIAKSIVWEYTLDETEIKWGVIYAKICIFIHNHQSTIKLTKSELNAL